MGACRSTVSVVVAAVALVIAAWGVSTAQTVRQAPAGESVAAQWALRGVVLSGKTRSAVLEHVPSGRQELVAVGAAVTPTLSVVEIDRDRVVLGSEGGGTTSLRLGHGGDVRSRVPARQPWRRR